MSVSKDGFAKLSNKNRHVAARGPALQSLVSGRACWTEEAAGSRALLAWIVLFHLLVNVWLLCMFTSLLIVMGGWLGSQAVLDTSSVVHLERFIKLERCLAGI
ncbi:sorting nexin-19 [Acipenser oxyrinchus oxyrinchus]|uniref:Sorting nexin-19 n=1 Tax=Acipenser oxyrinchus oxyrinchus TaxID=40147 RepID=A0AAD8CGA7_ACIOX|nr:sorting nexin-19 [Acipenser oxyrinchus oxyrinchus]